MISCALAASNPNPIVAEHIPGAHFDSSGSAVTPHASNGGWSLGKSLNSFFGIFQKPANNQLGEGARPVLIKPVIAHRIWTLADVLESKRYRPSEAPSQGCQPDSINLLMNYGFTGRCSSHLSLRLIALSFEKTNF